MPRKKYNIEFFSEQEEQDISVSLKSYMQRALGEIMKIFSLSECVSVAVSFVDEDAIRGYNKENRGIDRITDVLSFPLQNFAEGTIDEVALTDAEYDEYGFLMLGDVVICTSVSEKQAEEYGHSFERETVYLFVHSILHLLGFDHEEEEQKARMREKEEAIMNRIGLSRDE